MKLKNAYLWAGSSVHTMRWLNEMARGGYEVHLITMHPPTTDKLDDRVNLHLLPFGPPAGYYLNVWYFKRLLRRIKPDLLHTYYASGYGTLSRLSSFHPTLLSVWGSDIFVFPHGAKWKERLLRKNLAATDYIASTSYSMKMETEHFVEPKHPITVTPFGIDCKKFKTLDIKTNTPEIVIGTVKRLEPNLGIECLIRAFAILTKRYAEMKLRLLIVGGGSLRPKLEKLAKELKILHLTEFTGKVLHELVPYRLNHLSIYVCPSDNESFGVAVLEASACELPVVVTKVGGLPEVVRDGVTGFIVPKKNPGAIASAIEKLIMNPSLAKTMGSVGRRFVLTNYEWSKTVRIMKRLYERIIKEYTGQNSNSFYQHSLPR